MSDEGRRKFGSGKTIQVDEAELQAHLESLAAGNEGEALVVEQSSLPPPLPKRRRKRSVWFLGAAVIILGVGLGIGADGGLASSVEGHRHKRPPLRRGLPLRWPDRSRGGASRADR